MYKVQIFFWRTKKMSTLKLKRLSDLLNDIIQKYHIEENKKY